MVRVSKARNPFSRGFGQTYTEEIFRVRRQDGTNPVTYMLEDLQKEEIVGLFYEPEMVLVNNIEEQLVFRVEKVLARRTHNGRKEVLIKWKGYSDKFNLWQPAYTIKQ